MKRNIALAVIVAAAAAAAGFMAERMMAGRATLTQVDRPDDLQAPAAATRAKADDGSAADDADADAPRAHPIPETIPDITLPDADGRQHSLAEWKGHPLIINFWATWCGPCRAEIPLLRKLRHERTSERLEVIGIAIDERDAVLKYAHDIGMDYPVLIGQKEGYAAAEAFGAPLVLPFSVFADSQSRIVTVKIGELHPEEAEFILDRVRDIDSQRLALAAARQQIADRLRQLSIQRGKQAAAADAGA